MVGAREASENGLMGTGGVRWEAADRVHKIPVSVSKIAGAIQSALVEHVMAQGICPTCKNPVPFLRSGEMFAHTTEFEGRFACRGAERYRFKVYAVPIRRRGKK